MEEMMIPGIKIAKNPLKFRSDNSKTKKDMKSHFSRLT